MAVLLLICQPPETLEAMAAGPETKSAEFSSPEWLAFVSKDKSLVALAATRESATMAVWNIASLKRAVEWKVKPHDRFGWLGPLCAYDSQNKTLFYLDLHFLRKASSHQCGEA